MKVWISKYALTEGIFEAEAEADVTTSAGIIAVAGNCGDNYFHGEGREWHKSLESAQARACELRRRKIESIQKQIKRLELLTFIPKNASP